MKKPPRVETPKEEFIRQKKEAKKEMDLSDRSIEGWSDIILGKRKKKGGEQKMANGKVEKEATTHSYESCEGDTVRIDLGSEDYAIVHLNKDVFVDISFRSRTCTVYDDSPGWNVRQMGTSSGRMVECKTEAG